MPDPMHFRAEESSFTARSRPTGEIVRRVAAYLRRYKLRLDGFASAHAPYAGGELVTKPLRFAGGQLELNYSTSAPGGIRVEIQDASGTPIPGFTLAESKEIVGDEIARVVAWNSGADLKRLSGQPVRLRFVMRDADIYGLRFQD